MPGHLSISLYMWFHYMSHNFYFIVARELTYHHRNHLPVSAINGTNIQYKNINHTLIFNNTHTFHVKTNHIIHMRHRNFLSKLIENLHLILINKTYKQRLIAKR